MRVLVVCRRLPPQIVTGTGRMLLELADALRARHEVQVFGGEHADRGLRAAAGFEVALRAQTARFRPDVMLVLHADVPAADWPVVRIVAPQIASTGWGALSALRDRTKASRADHEALRLIPEGGVPQEGRDRAVPPGLHVGPRPSSVPRDGPIVCAAPLDGVHAAHIAVEAWLGLPEWAREGRRLVIAGPVADEGYAASLRRRGEGQGVDVVGAVSEVRALLDSASLIIVPRTGWGWGRALLEGMAAGRPVLYSSAAPLETLAGGEGIRFAANDVKALGESLRDTLRHQDGWAALGERGRERAARFDWSLVLPAWEQALRAAVG